MKKHQCFISLLLVLMFLTAPMHVQAEDAAGLTIEIMYDIGMSAWEIAEMADGGFTDYNSEFLKVTHAMVWIELMRRNIHPLAEMTDDDLIALQNEITAIQNARKEAANKSVTVPTGMYIVGVDIPAGNYTVSHTGKPAATHGNTNAYVASTITVYAADGKTIIGTYMAKHEEPIGKLTLIDGYHVKITKSPAVFSPYKGLDF